MQIIIYFLLHVAITFSKCLVLPQLPYYKMFYGNYSITV